MKSIIVLGGLLAALATADRAEADGKSVFDQVCSKCHRTGVLDAPIAGNKAMWEPRVKAGRDKLYESVLNGKNAMPPRGGKDRLSDEDAKAAVDYMVGLVGL
jgi:cytochrome c5